MSPPMALGVTLENATLLQLVDALSLNAERIGRELEKSPHRSKERNTASNQASVAHSGGNEITKRHLPLTPELLPNAWASSSRIDSMRNEMRPIYRLHPELLALVVDFYQLEKFNDYHPEAYEWVRLMLVSRKWKATILSFPSLWSKLVMSMSVSRLWILNVMERSGSHPLQVMIPPPARRDMYWKSIRLEQLNRVVELLPRISQLLIACYHGGLDSGRIYRAFKGRSADRLERFEFTPSLARSSGPSISLRAPRLRFLYISGVIAWPVSMAKNLTHVHVDLHLDLETLERGLNNSPMLKEIRISRVCYLSKRFENRPKICLVPGVQLIVTDSQNTVPSVFALGPTNYLSITPATSTTDLLVTSFLKPALPQDISCFQNLNDLTTVQLKLINSGEDPSMHTPGTLTMILRCFTADRETLHVRSVHHYLPSPDTVETGIIPERSPAMRALNSLRPLDLRNVAELRMEGFVGWWGLQSFELCHFLQHMPALRRIVTGDDNGEVFSFALGATGRGASATVEEA